MVTGSEYEYFIDLAQIGQKLVLVRTQIHFDFQVFIDFDDFEVLRLFNQLLFFIIRLTVDQGFV